MDLLQLWQNIHGEAVQLAESLARLPDVCECGDANAHLEGRCSCCSGHAQLREHGDTGPNCKAVIARLQADLTMLSEDLSLAGPPMAAAALEKQRFELRRGVFLAANDLQRILEAFKKLTDTVAGFRADCSVTRLQAIKRHSVELREHCERVNQELGSTNPVREPSA